MITRLFIKNFALIEHLEVKIENGFTVLSGETGAGKSIMLDAISLLMGKRSDRESLFDKSKKCILEMEVSLDYTISEIFKKHDLDFEKQTIIRREINPSGKNRSFINDSIVSLSVLNDICSKRIELYSQNQSISLKNEEKQLELIDKFSNTKEELKNYKEQFSVSQKIRREIENIKNGNKLSDSEIDFLTFQIEELEKSNLIKGEKENLEKEYKLLENSSVIIQNISESYSILSNENGVNDKVSEIENLLNKVADSSDKIEKLNDRISSIRIDLNDIESEFSEINNSIDSDPKTLNKVGERLDHLNSLLTKHRKTKISELLILLNEMNLKIQSSFEFEKLIHKKEIELERCKMKLTKLSESLSKKRKKLSLVFSKNIEKQLQKLGIKSPKLIIDFTKHEEFTQTGIDKIRFLFSANKGSEAIELHKVASGGELSRLMLCFSYIISENDGLSSMIFDEIDTGVSGEIADLMSEMMLEMSRKRQVISVTHLPQIASKAQQHFRVYKKENKERTSSEIIKLNKEERVEEIAKMLSGKNISSSAIINAKELLNQ